MKASYARSLLVIGSLAITTTIARAQPEVSDVEELVKPAEPTAASYEGDVVVRRSYLVPAIELVVFNIGANLGSRAAGEEWAEATPSSAWHNLTHEWVYDNDLFSVNQLAHPYGGAMLYSGARSSGHDFWVSSAYAFAGSLLWETLMETEPPSINDQITTSIGGAFIGEALHRWGRAVRGGGAHPGPGRELLSAVIDPAGTANREVFGDSWRRVPPPRLHAFMGVGYNAPLDDTTSGPFHGELAVSHGLPSDARFEPRVPFHHFDLRGQLNASTEHVTGYLDIRGMLFGTATGEADQRAIWGAFGSYSYWDAEGVRAGAIGFGPGVAVHQQLGERGFLDGSALVALVPWGAAGGTGDVEGMRDYEHGPGGAGVLEAKLGRRGLGMIRASGRAIAINGALVGDTRETVVVSSIGAMAAVAEHHALGVDVVYSARHANFTDATASALDQRAQVRVMYAVMSDDRFGGP
ncbi:MAG TPA: DUF3943 domain-containing protein [Kofleriaceae bacterium]|nr:DUF3943 domain-containing protein [Kofleriaceae bacterium]